MKRTMLALILITIIFSACNASTPKDTTTTTAEHTVTVDYSSIISEKIEGCTMEGAAIIDVSVADGIITIHVDISNVASIEGCTTTDIALRHVASITDSILDDKSLDPAWSEIIVDFGDIGRVVNTKANIQEDEFGRCFVDYYLINH